MEKIKYLDMENATLKLQLNSVKEYIEFFTKYKLDLLDLNFKRIYVKILNQDLEALLKDLQQFNLPLIIETEIINDLNFDIPDNIIVVNTNSNFQIEKNNLYNQVLLNELNLEKIINLINKDANIIVEPEVDVKNVFKINDSFNSLFKNVPNKLINIGNFIIPTALLKEHPCNCYLCDGWKCHKKISGLPKVVLIDCNYNLYPHCIINKNLFMGNLYINKFQTLLVDYLKSDEYTNFINCCKRVYIEYLPNYPFQYFPVAEFIKEVANEM